MAYLDKNAILSSLTRDDVKKIIEGLGCADYKEDSQGNLCFSTALCHGGDSPYKLVYYEPKSGDTEHRYGIVHCYTCGDSYSLIELVIRANRVKGKTITWFKALSWIAQVTGRTDKTIEPPSPGLKKIDDWRWINRFKSAEYKKAIELPEINENILDIFSYLPYEGWIEEGISPEIMSEFEIGYYVRDNAISIPHRDTNGRLIGIRERHLDKQEAEAFGKYTPIRVENQILNHPLGQNLYGIWINKDRIMESRKVLLVEGEKSVLQCNSMFGDNSFALAVCGSNITQEQTRMLLEDLKVSEVIIGFDREYEDPYSYQAEIYKNKLLKKVIPIVPYCKVSLLLDDKDRLGYKDSPTDKGKNVLLELLDEKIEVTTKDVNESLQRGNNDGTATA